MCRGSSSTNLARIGPLRLELFGGMEVVEGEGCVSSVLTKSKEGMQYNEFTKPTVSKQIILSNQVNKPTIGNQG